ncbi:MAG TPA: glycosyltransferase 87 family protein [Acidimicrobiia bacterium]|nr:glycosyltransferase 87 family protein [Acidimicrobiia bacterium]
MARVHATAVGVRTRPVTPAGTRPDDDRIVAAPTSAVRTASALRVVLVAVAVAFVAMYVAIAVARMRYPYELEWMEGGVLDHVRRVVDGHGVYGRPSLGFTPYLYTPLYYYVAAVPATLFGSSFFSLRLVSFVASLGAFGCAGLLVYRETRDRFAAVVAGCILAACFRRGGAWFDLARIDSLFLALTLAGLLLVRRARTSRAAAVAAIVMAAACFTKQEALLPALAVLPFLWRAHRRLALWYAGVFAAAVVGASVVFEVVSRGWFSFYALQLPSRHEIVTREYWAFWTEDLLAPLAIATLAGALGLWWAARRGDPERGGVRVVWFWGPVTGALVAAAYTGRLHSGGYDNVLLPLFAALAMTCGLGLHAARTWQVPGLRAWTATAVLVLVIAQLASLTYDPTKQVPTSRDRAEGAALLARLRALPGSVYLPGHGVYLERVGKPGVVQSAAFEDVLRADLGSTSRDLGRALHDAIAHQRYDWVVVDSARTFSYLPKGFRHAYVRVGYVGDRHHPLLPLTGTRTGPLTLWAPRR